MHAGEDAGADFPDFFAVEVVSGDEHLIAIKKADIYFFAVGQRCRGSVAVEFVDSFDGGLEDHSPPEYFPIFTVEAEQKSPGFVFEGGDEEDAVLPDNGRSVTFTGNWGFPDDVFRAAPGNGDIFFEAGSVASRTSPCGPVFGLRVN